MVFTPPTEVHTFGESMTVSSKAVLESCGGTLVHFAVTLGSHKKCEGKFLSKNTHMSPNKTPRSQHSQAFLVMTCHPTFYEQLHCSGTLEARSFLWSYAQNNICSTKPPLELCMENEQMHLLSGCMKKSFLIVTQKKHLICFWIHSFILFVSTHAPPGTLTLPTLSQKPCAQRVGTSSSWISILLPLKSESSYRQILCSMLSCREEIKS